jgi:flagellar motility protein MotE (MotC chaperone)
MFRTLVQAINAVLVLFAAGVVGFAGWLFATDRIDGSRLRAIAETIERVPSDRPVMFPSEQVVTRAGETATASGVSSDERIESLHESQLHTAWASQRLERQADVLREELRRTRDELNREREIFEKERSQWEESRSAAAARDADAAFQQVIQLLQSMPPRDASAHVREIARKRGPEAAARYLAAMQPFPAAEIMRWLGSADDDLAAELIEAMQTPGSPHETSEPDRSP